MEPRDSAWSAQDDSPEAARARLAGALQLSGHAFSEDVREAFARVPRHVFVPEVGAAAAYRDEAFVIKYDDDGLPVSSSSQPAMMAIMLDQAGLRRGHRVLEIGTGSGYNAAVMSAVVGPRGQVSTVDIDAELVGRARDSLAGAGFDSVTVRCADGGFGDPAGAPFDRIIVTAGAWDIAPAWLDQLALDGVLVLPLSVRGIQLSVALQRTAGGWLSISAWRCGFVRMLGAFAGPETVLQLSGAHALSVQMSDGATVDGPALQRALTGPSAEAGAIAGRLGQGELGDLDLWLTVTAADLDRATLLSAPGGWLPLAALLPFGALVSHAADAERIGVAVLLASETASGAGPGVTIGGFGPGGGELAAELADRVTEWDRLGRPGVQDLRLAVRLRDENPPGPSGLLPAGALVMPRPSVIVEASCQRLA
jgi:protein-L-isoaspartate(D-aspartate) O-methyltransferase